MTDYWYRYDNITDGVSLSKYPVGKVTPKGVWLDDVGLHGRFVLRDARKRFACPTKEEAMVSFIARKTRQRMILKAQLRNIEAALELVGDGKDIQDDYANILRRGIKL